MVEYMCSNCHKKFQDKCDYDRHLNRKYKCNHNDDINQLGVENFNIIETINKLIDSNEKLTKKVEELEKKVVKMKNNVTINADTINIVNLVAHGSEDLSFLTESDHKKLVMLGFKSIPKFVEMVHCNKNKPEYKNIYISSKKNLNKVMVYNGDKWKLCSSDIVDDLYDRGIDYIEGQFDELKEKGKIPRTAIKRLERVFEQLNDNGGHDKKRKISDDIKLILYNNRPN